MQAARRGRAGLGGVIGRQGDRQHLAERLDPELLFAAVVEGSHFFYLRPSSSPKKAAAAFKISLARLSSRFSPARRSSCSHSSLVVPGRRPSAVSACRPIVSGPNRRLLPDKDQGM